MIDHSYVCGLANINITNKVNFTSKDSICVSFCCILLFLFASYSPENVQIFGETSALTY